MPGGVTEIQYETDGSWKTRDLVNTGKINLVSNGLRMGNYVLASSFFYDGFVACPIDNTVPFDNWIAYPNTKAVNDLLLSAI